MRCPLTRKRFEKIWKRLRAHLVWFDQMHGRPHDLRKTMGTFVERAFGHAVAKRWLRHADDDVTDTYTLASDEEVRAVHDAAWPIAVRNGCWPRFTSIAMTSPDPSRFPPVSRSPTTSIRPALRPVSTAVEKQLSLLCAKLSTDEYNSCSSMSEE